MTSSLCCHTTLTFHWASLMPSNSSRMPSATKAGRKFSIFVMPPPASSRSIRSPCCSTAADTLLNESNHLSSRFLLLLLDCLLVMLWGVEEADDGMMR